MRKTAKILVALAGVLLVGRGMSWAVAFSDIVDFECDGSYLGASCEKIKGDIFTQPFECRLGSVPGGVKWNSATLSLTHSGNTWGWEHPEAWVLYGEDANTKELRLLGALSQSGGRWQTDSFALDPAWLDAAGAGGDPWELKLCLYDPTIGLDDLYLDRAVLSGDYAAAGNACEPVPEPGSLALLASGIMGLAGMQFGKKFVR